MIKNAELDEMQAVCDADYWKTYPESFAARARADWPRCIAEAKETRHRLKQIAAAVHHLDPFDALDRIDKILEGKGDE